MRKIFLLFCIGLFFSDICFADIIILKDGTQIEGEITSDAPDQIGVKTEKKTFFILKEKIEKIIKTEDNEKNQNNLNFILTAGSFIVACVVIFFLVRAGNTY